MHMRKIIITTTVAVVTVVLTGGCTSSNAADETCAKARSTIKHYTTDAPEFKAVTEQIEKAYNGAVDPDAQEAAQAAYETAFSNALRSVADDAKEPELKAAITTAADAYSTGKPDVKNLQNILALCA
ncbi:hypothetical protein ACQEVZ_00245 [Dactylosporangium sp. CA-152071]|uniref:hypothetical protein n=1 Tax=Dactylosporangium sp. CA-152071 TaxID=3239933 RepID=UPI003D8E4C10